MKRKTIISTLMVVVAIAALSLTSCTKDFNQLILGKWNVTRAQSEAILGGASVPKDLTKAYVAFEFQEDGTCLMTTKEMNPMTGVLLSDKDSVRHYNWSLVNNNKVKIVTPSNYEINYDITYLNEKKLSFHGSTFDTVPGFPALGKIQMEMNIDMVK